MSELPEELVEQARDAVMALEWVDFAPLGQDHGIIEAALEAVLPSILRERDEAWQGGFDQGVRSGEELRAGLQARLEAAEGERDAALENLSARREVVLTLMGERDRLREDLHERIARTYYRWMMGDNYADFPWDDRNTPSNETKDEADEFARAALSTEDRPKLGVPDPNFDVNAPTSENTGAQ